MWLMIAIENAKKVQADRCSDLSQVDSANLDQHSKLRRLWWCCIIRDRILSLGLRRSIQVMPAHFDFRKNMDLGCSELQAEIQRSRVHSEDAKQGLSTVIKHIVKLAIVLTDILLLVFPLNNTIDSSKDIQKQLQGCNEALSEWYGGTPFHGSNGEAIATDPSVLLNVTLMYTYYQ